MIMKIEEFIESDMSSFLNEKSKELKESGQVREEESPLLYNGKDFKKDIEVALSTDDLNKAKTLFDSCRSEYVKILQQKNELHKTLETLKKQIKDHLDKQGTKVWGDQSIPIENVDPEEILNTLASQESTKEPITYTGGNFLSDLDSALTSKDWPRAKAIFIVCKEELNKTNEENVQLYKTTEELYKKIKDHLKKKKQQSLEGEISVFEEESKIQPKEEKVFSNLFTATKIIPVRRVESAKQVQQPIIQTGWTAEEAPTPHPVEPMHTETQEHITRMHAEKLMEDKIKERINESCGVIKLALEKKDLHRAILEYNKLKEIYTLIPSILSEEKSAIYQKIISIYKEIKRAEQDRLMARLSSPAEHQLTEEELVDKISGRIDRTQAFILNKDLQKAVEEYQEANDLFDLLPETLPEIKKRFLVELARLYQGLQNLNGYMQKKRSQTLFDHEPDKVLPKYAPNNPVERVRRSMSKIERYLQAKAVKSAMLEFNKIKSLCDHLPPLEDQEKKILFEEIKSLYSKIDKTRREYHEEGSPKMEIVDIKDSNEAHLEQVKSIHEDIKVFYSEVKNNRILEAQGRLLDIQHKIALLPDEKEQKQLLIFLDQLCNKTHFAEQEKRLAKSSEHG